MALWPIRAICTQQSCAYSMGEADFGGGLLWPNVP